MVVPFRALPTQRCTFSRREQLHNFPHGSLAQTRSDSYPFFIIACLFRFELDFSLPKSTPIKQCFYRPSPTAHLALMSSFIVIVFHCASHPFIHAAQYAAHCALRAGSEFYILLRASAAPSTSSSLASFIYLMPRSLFLSKIPLIP